MSEIEVPTEQLQETVQEHAKEAQHDEEARSGQPGKGTGHGSHSGDDSRLSGSTMALAMRVAISSALLALLAAIAALMAGAHENEAMIDQLQASDQWAFYQAKSIKSAILSGVAEVMIASGKEVNDEDKKKVEKYQEEMKDIMREANEKQEGSRKHLVRHETLARAVTLFQVGIALGALAMLTRKRELWLLGLLVAMGGGVFFLKGVL